VWEEGPLETIHARCCGLDVHQKQVVACLLTSGPDGAPCKEIRTYGTMTENLLALLDWLVDAGCTHVALESTGVYCKPIHNLFEGTLTVLVVNAQHIKTVPGRKTHVKDAEWIATLLRHGLLRASFIPDREQREVRELTRYRTSLRQERAAEVSRLHKHLEGANIKLGAVASNIVGLSARHMLHALANGQTDATALAQLAQGRLRDKIPQLEQALAGTMGPHQRFLLAQQLTHLDDLDALIRRIDGEIAARLRAEEETLAHLDSIPGVGRTTAEVLVAEIGTDMGRFPSAAHLASWAGLAPGNNESAGKRHSGKTGQGSPWLRAALVEAAQAVARSKTTALGAYYRRLAARRGRKRAAVATAHRILEVVYHLLKEGTDYREPGPGYYVERDRIARARRLIRQLHALGYEVTQQSPPLPAA
jgi:transposase